MGPLEALTGAPETQMGHQGEGTSRVSSGAQKPLMVAKHENLPQGEPPVPHQLLPSLILYGRHLLLLPLSLTWSAFALIPQGHTCPLGL